jgi:PAS domain S-box-containing protein
VRPRHLLAPHSDVQMSEWSGPISASTEQWLESASDGVVIIDETGLIRLVNRQAEAMFGYVRGELEGQSIEVLVPEMAEDLHRGHRGEFFREPVRRPMATGLDIFARRKDGSEFPADVSLSLLETDRGLLVSAAVRDITDRKQIETALRGLDAAARLAAIVESSQDAIVGKTLDGVITSWNAAAQRLYGYTASEIMGHNISELTLPHRSEELAPIIERLRRGEPVQHFDTQRMSKNGEILDLSMAISPIRDATDTIIGASAVARDMTEIRRAERHRRALEAQLHRAQRLESLGQLAGGVAHDFNNLLAGIMNYAGLVAANLRDEMSQRGLVEDDAIALILNDVGQISAVAKRAAALTRQLLIFSRREVLQPETLDLNVLVRDMEELLRRTIGQNVESLQTVLAPELPLILGDRGQIEQVIMNLAVNARDAMPAGGELGIETAVFEVDADDAQIHELKPGTYVRLSVSDTGTGMPADVAARAFEPFFTTKRPGEGTGLGLATVFGIVTQADGYVTIDSEPDVGTTVRVHLPATMATRLDPRPLPDSPIAANSETVLLVEDEEIVRESARRILARYGYTVLAASNADDALAIVRRNAGPIDLLLSDVVMPGRSGKQLSADVIAQRPTIKVLFMSGYSENVIVHKGVIDAGVSLIEKPFSADDLLRKVRDVLDGGV